MTLLSRKVKMDPTLFSKVLRGIYPIDMARAVIIASEVGYSVEQFADECGLRDVGIVTTFRHTRRMLYPKADFNWRGDGPKYKTRPEVRPPDPKTLRRILAARYTSTGAERKSRKRPISEANG